MGEGSRSDMATDETNAGSATMADMTVQLSIVSRATIDTVLRVGAVLLLLVWCFVLVRPFIAVVVWGIIIAVAVHPMFLRLRSLMGGRGGWTAALLTVATLLVLAIPLTVILRAVIANVSALAAILTQGHLDLPEPPLWLPGLPLIGQSADRLWRLAMINLGGAMSEVAPQLRVLSAWLLSLVAGTSLGILSILASIIVAGLLLAHDSSGAMGAKAVASRLAGARGPALVALSEATVRNVTKGVLGTALIQSTMAGVGLALADVPGAGLLTLLCFLLCIVQIGPGLVLLPAVIYVMSHADALIGILFLVWSLLTGLLDTVLRPYLIGRGSTVPMAVILLGVLGGLLVHGLVGVFIGPVVLALAYELIRAWLDERTSAAAR